MPMFELHADDGISPGLLDMIEATNLGEAISLVQLRLERRELELRDGRGTVARVSKDGRVSLPTNSCAR